MPKGKPGAANVTIEVHASQTAARKTLRSGWDYMVLIQGEDDFNAVFDSTGQSMQRILTTVFSRRFAERLEATALVLGQTLYVEVVGKSHGDLKAASELRVHHEAPALLILQATYSEGEVQRILRSVGAATA